MKRQGPCKDCVSRQAALKALEKEIPIGFGDDATGGYIDGLARASEVIKNLPSVCPTPKTGHWIKKEHGPECSECHSSPLDFIDIMGGEEGAYAYVSTPMPRCPNCGTRMEE